MAGLPYTPGNYQHGAHINVTGQFNNLYSSGAFKLPEDPRIVANQVLAAFSTITQISLTGGGTQPLTLPSGFVSIRNSNNVLPAVDIQVVINGSATFVIPPTTSIFLMVFNGGGAQQII